MKFRYYLCDAYDGSVKGTDNEELAKSYAESEDFFVVDTETGDWLQFDGSRVSVEEMPN